MGRVGEWGSGGGLQGGPAGGWRGWRRGCVGSGTRMAQGFRGWLAGCGLGIGKSQAGVRDGSQVEKGSGDTPGSLTPTDSPGDPKQGGWDPICRPHRSHWNANLEKYGLWRLGSLQVGSRTMGLTSDIRYDHHHHHQDQQPLSCPPLAFRPGGLPGGPFHPPLALGLLFQATGHLCSHTRMWRRICFPPSLSPPSPILLDKVANPFRE